MCNDEAGGTMMIDGWVEVMAMVATPVVGILGWLAGRWTADVLCAGGRR